MPNSVARVAETLASLTREEELSPSLCEGWRIQEVAAHLTMPFRVGNPRFFVGVLAPGGGSTKVMDRFARQDSGEAPTG